MVVSRIKSHAVTFVVQYFPPLLLKLAIIRTEFQRYLQHRGLGQRGDGFYVVCRSPAVFNRCSPGRAPCEPPARYTTVTCRCDPLVTLLSSVCCAFQAGVILTNPFC